jgi:hypothetical protein
LVLLFDEHEVIRHEKDWIEEDEFKNLIEQENCTINQVDADDYSSENIEKWYLLRTIEIENLSGLVDIALNFAELG